MRADTHDGPEQNRSTSRPNTLMQLSRSSLLELRLATRGRAIHFGTYATFPGGSRKARYQPKTGHRRASIDARLLVHALGSSARRCPRAGEAARGGREE